MRARLTLAALGALAAVACGESPSTSGANDPLNAAPESGGIDFRAFEQTVFGDGTKTEGVVVLHRGRLVYEKYAAGYDAGKRHLAYSVSKSIGSALLGIAIGEGLMRLGNSVCAYVAPPEGADPALCTTTIQHLVQMSSGIGWSESYVDPAHSNVLPMLYGDESDTGGYVARLPRATVAGTKMAYSSGDSNLLARAIKGALGGRDMRAWANEKLFEPSGMRSAVFESDRSGTLLFSSGAFLTPRDMARFGQLYLDDGRAGTKRVLPEGWVTYTQTPSPPLSTPTVHQGDDLGQRGGSYGASFWLNAARPDAPLDTLFYAEAPRDTFCAQGHWGQRICMVPSRDLVVVRVGNDRVGFYDVGPAVGAAVAAVDQHKGAAR